MRGNGLGVVFASIASKEDAPLAVIEVMGVEAKPPQALIKGKPGPYIPLPLLPEGDVLPGGRAW